LRYPTQLIALVANLLIFFTLLAVERYGSRRSAPSHTWPFDGFLFLLYVELYSLKRFSLEFLRADAEPVMGPFTVTHFLCGAIIVLVGGYLVIRRCQHSASPQASEPVLP
jgi:prolipoprotein diacylglyceryltransferase